MAHFAKQMHASVNMELYSKACIFHPRLLCQRSSQVRSGKPPPVQEKVCSGKDLFRLPSDERANLGGYVAPGIRLGDAFDLEVSHVGLGGFQITKRNISNSTPVPRKIDTARFCCALTINTSRSIRQSIQASQRNLALADFA